MMRLYTDRFIQPHKGVKAFISLSIFISLSSAVRADLIIESGASLGVAQGAVVDSSGSVVINSGGTLTSTGTVRLTKDWNNSGTFAANTSTVTFYNVMTSSITGNNTFYVLIATENAGKTIQFQQNSTQTVRNIFNLGGTSGNEVKLRSTTDGTGWYLSLLTGNITLNFVDVKDGQASGATITCNNSINSGNNNANWVFTEPAFNQGMLTNPGFETGDTQGWGKVPPGTGNYLLSITGENRFIGDYAAKITTVSAASARNYYISQNVTISGGTRYNLSGFIYKNDSTTPETYLAFRAPISSPAITDIVASLGTSTSTTQIDSSWRFLTLSTVAISGATGAKILIGFRTAAGVNATSYFDNIYFSTDTPPSAVSNLTALQGDNHGEIKLRWTAPGADGTQGPYKGSFILKYSSAGPITTFDPPNVVVTTVTISTSVFNPTRMHTEIITPPVAKGATWYFAVAAFDGLFSTGTWSLTGVNSLSSSTVKDSQAPNAISDLTALSGSGNGEINLRWSAPGDDGTSNTLLGNFTIKYSSIGIINESQFDVPPASLFVATVTVSTSGVLPGTSVGRSFSGLTSATRYWFAIKYQDSAGNLSVWKSSADNSSFNNLLSTESQALPDAPTNLAQYVGNFVALSSTTWTNYQQVRATFTLSDPNSADTMQFNIQFSSWSDFRFLFINSTSASGIAQGATNFVNSTLFPEGTWYWRVKANDNNGGQSAYSLMNQVSGSTIAFRIDATTPASVTPTITRSSNAAAAMELSWSVVTDTTSGIIGYRIYRVTATTISNADKVPANLIASTSTVLGSSTTYTDSAAALSANTTYSYAVCAVDAAGNEADVSGATLRTARIDIDGDFSDWNTGATSNMFDNTAILNETPDGREWIFKDKAFERRSDPVLNLGNYDLFAVHMKADEEFVYFLARYDDLVTFNGTFYFAISIDTDQVSNQSYGNWNADDSGMALGNGGDAYPETVGAGGFLNRAEKQIIIHSVGGLGPIIELYSPPNGTQWHAPDAPGDGAVFAVIANSGGNDGVEFKISRSTLGLVGNKTARISAATYKPAVPLGWANDIDTTDNFFAVDALDAMSIVRISSGSGSTQYYNDAAHNMSAWDEDISDGDLDFWTDIPLVGNGLAANTAPSVPTAMTPLNATSTNTLRPTLKWSGASDSDSGDTITSYLVEFATWSGWPSDPQANISGAGAYGFRVNVATNNWQIPSDLADFTTYYWRVWARDKRGALSGIPTLWKFWVQSDTIAPSAITNLVAIAGDGNSDENYRKITLQWTSPGDDNLTGNLIGQFEIRYLIGNNPIVSEADWDSASSNSILVTTTSAGVPSWAPGVTVSSVVTLTAGATYNFAIKAADEVQNSAGTRMNWSALDTTAVEPSTRAPATFHHITADGSGADWDTSTERMGNDTRNGMNDSLFITWSSTQIAFRWQASSAATLSDFFILIDTHASFSVTQGSNSPVNYDNAVSHKLPFYADYLLAFEDVANERGIRQYNPVANDWPFVSVAEKIASLNVADAANSVNEWLVNISTLGSPKKIWVMAYRKGESDRIIYTAFPTQNSAPATDTAVTFSYFWELNLSSTQFPAEAKILVNQNPRAISDLTALTGSADGDIRLEWTAPANADGSNITDGTYNIKYATTQITSSNFDTVPLAQTQTISTNTVAGQAVGKLVTGLNPGTTYFFALKINNGANSSVWNVSGSVNSRSSAPAADLPLSAPTNISALGGDVSSTTIKIRWIVPAAPTYVDDRSSYTLYAATAVFSSVNNSWVIRSSEVAHPLAQATSSQMTPNSTYFFAVTAIDSGTITAGLYSVALESATIPTSIYSTPTLAAIPPPSAFVPADVGESSITFRWTSGNNPAGTFYQANVSTSNDFVNFTTSDTFALSATSSALSTNTTYYFRVRARNHQQLFTDWSQTVSTKTLPGDTSAPAPITDFSAAQGSNAGEINITWSAPGDDGHIGNITSGKYRIDYSTDANRNFVITNYQIEISSNINQGQKHGRVLTGLKQGATYYIRVYTADEVPNWSGVSNGATQWATRAGGGDGAEAMLVYFSSTPTNSDTTKPGYRTFDGFQWESVGFGPSGGKEASGFHIVRAKPNSNERVAGWQTSDGEIKLAVFDGNNWGNFHSVSNEAVLSGQRKFDIAYEEGGGGEAIVVFRSSAASNGVPRYTVWNGTSWSAPATISGWTLDAPINWLRLAAKPNSDEILAVAMQGTNKRITAMVWNGSSWGNFKNLTEDLSTSVGATVDSAEGLDATYQFNGTGFVVWGTTNGAINVATYTTAGGWSATAISSTPAQLTGTGTDALRWVKAKPRPKSNEILIAAAEQTATAGSADLHLWVWDGTKLSAYAEVDADIQPESGVIGTRHFDVAYERSSRDGMVLWADDVSPVKYRVITGNTIGAEQNGPAWPGGNELRWLSLTQDQSTNSDNLYLLLGSSNGVFSYARWTGTSWETTQTFESYGNSGSPAAEWFAITSKWVSPEGVDNIAPGAISDLTALPVSESKISLQWTAPGDNQQTGDLLSGSLFRIKYSSVGIINSADFESPPAILAVQTLDISTSATVGAKQGTTIASLQVATSYWFAIKTRDNAENWSIWNSSADVSTVNILLSTRTTGFPSAPSNVRYFGVMRDSVSITWDLVSGNAYTMAISSKSDFSLLTATGTGATNQNTTSYANLNVNVTYYFKVKISTHSDSSYSAAIATATLSVVPGTASFSPADMGVSSITFNWSASTTSSFTNPSGTRFQVQISTDSNFGVFSTSETFSLSATSSALSANTTYYFRVRAINHSGLPSDFSVTMATPTLATSPGMTYTIGFTSIAVTVYLNGNPVGTTVSVSTGSASNQFNVNNTTTAVSTNTVHTLILNGLTSDTPYTLRARSLNYSNLPSTVTVTSTNTLVGAITMEGFKVYTTSVSITIGRNTLPDGRQIVISTGTDANFNVSLSSIGVIAGQNTTLTIFGLSTNTAYAFQAGNLRADLSTASLEVTPSTYTLSVPPAVNSFSVFRTSITVNLGLNTNPSGTTLEISSGSFEVSTSSSGPISSISLSALSPNTTYTILARSKNGNNSVSESVTVTSTPTVAAVPSGLSFTSVSSDSLTASWNANNNPTSTRYEAHVSTDSNFGVYSTSETFTTSVTSTTLTPETFYYIRVRAKNHQNLPSDWSATASTQTSEAPAPPPPPASGGFLTNPGFETGDPNTYPPGWTTTVATANASIITNPVFAGSQAAQIWANNTGRKSIAQTLLTTPGATYYFAGFLQIQAGDTPTDFGLWVTSKDVTATSAIGGGRNSTQTTNASDWTFLYQSTIAGVNMTEMRLHVGIRDATNPQATGYLDNIYFNQDIPPSHVSDLTALTGSAHGEIKLRWTAPGADGTEGPYRGSFIVKYSSQGPITDFNNPPAFTSTQTVSTSVFSPGAQQTYTVGNLQQNVTWYFAVAHFDGLFSTGSWTVGGTVNARSSTTAKDLLAPGAISDLTALTGSASGEINLQWTAPGDDGTILNLPTGSLFRIKYSSIGIINSSDFDAPPASLFVSTISISTSATQGTKQGYVVTGLNTGATYWFAIKTRDDGGNWSVWNSSADVSTVNTLLSTITLSGDVTAPGVIITLSALTGTSTGTVNLTWVSPGDDGGSGSLDPGTFRIFYSSVASDVAEVSATDPATATRARLDISTSSLAPSTTVGRTITGLIENQTYYFRIFTGDEVPNWSAISNAATAQSQLTILSILISAMEYDFGTVPISGSTQSQSAIIVTNDGNVPETFNLRASTATPSPVTWSVGSSTETAPGNDTFLLRAVFNSTRPAVSDFAPDDIVGSQIQAATSSRYSVTGATTAVAVPANESRSLWYYLQMPLTTSTTWQQRINTTITVTQP